MGFCIKMSSSDGRHKETSFWWRSSEEDSTSQRALDHFVVPPLRKEEISTTSSTSHCPLVLERMYLAVFVVLVIVGQCFGAPTVYYSRAPRGAPSFLEQYTAPESSAGSHTAFLTYLDRQLLPGDLLSFFELFSEKAARALSDLSTSGGSTPPTSESIRKILGEKREIPLLTRLGTEAKDRLNRLGEKLFPKSFSVKTKWVGLNDWVSRKAESYAARAVRFLDKSQLVSASCRAEGAAESEEDVWEAKETPEKDKERK